MRNSLPYAASREIHTALHGDPVTTPQSAPAAPAKSIWVFPGLGCRYVGMGHDLFGQHPVADQLIRDAEDWLGYDVRAVCLEGSGRKYVSPRHEAQVIYILECAYAAVLAEQGYRPQAVSGHSLGSWAAAYAGGAYPFLTGLELVTHVEQLLEELVDGRGQAMGVIIGLEEAVVESLLAEHAETCVSNWNSPGQYVISGLAGDVDSVLTAAAGLGAKRAKRLPTERALHSSHMATIGQRLRTHLQTITWLEPQVPFAGSDDASLLRTAEEIRDFLAEFLVLPVRWDATVRALRSGWNGGFVEVGPGNVLSGMMPFIDRAAAIQSVSEILAQSTAL